LKNENRPADAPEPDYAWKSKTKDELNVYLRDLWSKCKTRLICPNCEHVGNISTSSAYGELRLQCITKGLQNGTKKGQCNKSWSLDNSIIVLKYALEKRPTENVMFWWEKPCNRRDVGSSSASASKSVKSQLFTRKVSQPQPRSQSSLQVQPIAILKRKNQIQPAQSSQDPFGVAEGICTQDSELVATQVMQSRRLPNVSFGKARPLSPETSSDKQESIGTQATSSMAGPTKLMPISVYSSQSNLNRRKQSPFQSLSVKMTQPLPTHPSERQDGSSHTPLGSPSQRKSDHHDKRNAQRQNEEVGLIREFQSSQQQNCDQQEQLMEVDDAVFNQQFNRNDVLLGSGSDPDLLSGLTKFPRKLSTQERRKYFRCLKSIY
jgi:hypothetical protein